MKEKGNTLIILNIGLLIMSMAPILGKLITWPAELIIFGRTFVAAICLLIYLWISKSSLRLQNVKDILLFISISMLLVIHWITYFASAKVSTVAIASISLFTYPIMTTLLEPIWHAERLRAKDIGLSCIALLGVVLMIEEYSFGNTATQGILLGLISALAFVFRNIVSRSMIKQYTAPQLMMYQMIFGSLLLFPIFFLATPEYTAQNIILLLLLGIVATAISHTIYLSSLSNLTARTAGVLSTIQPLYIVLIGIFILHEIPSLRIIGGGALVLTTVILEIQSHTK